MCSCALRVVQEPQRDPTRVKLGFNAPFPRNGRMSRTNLIRGPRVVQIEDFSGKKPTFGPPRVAVDEISRLARSRQHNFRGCADFVPMPQLMDLRKNESRIGMQG